MRFKLRSVRVRMTLWHLLAMATILVIFAVGVHIFVRSSLFRQVDRRLDTSFLAVQNALQDELDELDEVEEHGQVDFFQVTRDGQVIYESSGWARSDLDSGLMGTSPDLSWTWKSPAGLSFQFKSGTVQDENQSYRAVVALEVTAVLHSLRSLGRTLLIGFPLALLLSVLGGYFLSKRVLAPVGNMASKAREISASRLHERLPVENPDDEFGQLASVFNDTLARLHNSFEQLKRFTADASHELRTPLTAMRSVAEVGLKEARDPAFYRDVIGSLLEEVDHLTRLVDSLLVLTRSDSARLDLETERMDLCGLAGEVIEFLRVLADEKEQTISLNAGEPVIVVGDRALLRQALVNILHNAIKYMHPGGAILITADLRPNGEAVMEIRDEGPGIPPEYRDKVFNRFYRVEQDRSGDLNGVGLGLSIASWAVEANGGRIEMESEEGVGSTFRIILPSAESASSENVP